MWRPPTSRKSTLVSATRSKPSPGSKRAISSTISGSPSLKVIPYSIPCALILAFKTWSAGSDCRSDLSRLAYQFTFQTLPDGSFTLRQTHPPAYTLKVCPPMLDAHVCKSVHRIEPQEFRRIHGYRTDY